MGPVWIRHQKTITSRPVAEHKHYTSTLEEQVEEQFEATYQRKPRWITWKVRLAAWQHRENWMQRNFGIKSTVKELYNGNPKVVKHWAKVVQPQNVINSIKDENGSVLTDSESITSCIRKYYKKLYKNENIDPVSRYEVLRTYQRKISKEHSYKNILQNFLKFCMKNYPTLGQILGKLYGGHVITLIVIA